MVGRAWDELEKATVLTHEADGFVFQYVRPSGLLLNSLGIIVAADIQNIPRDKDGQPNQAATAKATAGVVNGLLESKEKQDKLLVACMIEPRLCHDGETVAGCREVNRLGQYRDALVLAMIHAFGGSEAEIEAVRFPDEASDGAKGLPDGEGGGDAPAGRPAAAGKRVRA